MCRASELKCDSYLFKNNPLVRPYCDLCNTLSIENVEHLLMYVPYFNDRREAMFREINDLENCYDTVILTPLGIDLLTMLGKKPEHAKPEVML